MFKLSDKNLENQEKPDVKEKIMLDLKRKKRTRNPFLARIICMH